VKLHRIFQHFDRPQVSDIESTVRAQLAGSGIKFPRGGAIAIAVGSRGIANLDRIVRTVVDFIAAAGAKPFIIPAMGSHGGATARGQAELLATYGITEETMGCPVRSSMDVVQLDRSGLPNAVFMDRHAWNSQGVILINRIKPHTDFLGRFGSGLAKMAVIGLGKEKQASEMHRFGVHGLKELVPQTAAQVLATGKILLGLAIVENAYDETALIEAVPVDVILTREPELLKIAHANMPRLPVDDIDVLIVDRLGKNISGTGMDTNIIGRIRIAGEPERLAPRIRSIVVTDLTPESHGNATGMGLADVVTRRFQDKTDFAVTYTNIITSGFLERGKLPVVAENDRQAFEIALRGAGSRDPESARVIRIRDTLHLAELLVSWAILAEVKGRANIVSVGQAVEAFESSGELQPFG
jgi:hypothetical protein